MIINMHVGKKKSRTPSKEVCKIRAALIIRGPMPSAREKPRFWKSFCRLGVL